MEEIKELIATTDPTIVKQRLNALTKVIYDAMDSRKPYGCLDAVELKYELKNIGKEHELAQQGKKAMEAIDADKDGCGTLAEYQAAALCYFTSENRADVCTQFFGELGVF